MLSPPSWFVVHRQAQSSSNTRVAFDLSCFGFDYQPMASVLNIHIITLHLNIQKTGSLEKPVNIYPVNTAHQAEQRALVIENRRSEFR